jgi:WD40 repeat protein
MRGREVQLWDLDTRQARALGGFPRGVGTLDWSADGRWLAAAGGPVLRAWHGDGLEPDQGLRLTGHAEAVRFAGFQPRGPFLASAGTDGFVVLWYPPAERPVAALALGAPAGAAAWAPDGHRLAIGTGDGRLIVLGLTG